MNDLVPLDDNTKKMVAAVAEATGKGIEAAQHFFGYLAGIFGTVPDDIIGYYLGGDRLHHTRLRNSFHLAAETEAILKKRGVEKPEPISETIGAPIIEAAAKENRPEIQRLWARLLANAVDPSRRSRVRQSFVEVCKRLDPLDALVLDQMFRRSYVVGPLTGSGNVNINFDSLASQFNTNSNEIEVSLAHLEELKCVNQLTNRTFTLNTYGRTFMMAVQE